MKTPKRPAAPAAARTDHPHGTPIAVPRLSSQTCNALALIAIGGVWTESRGRITAVHSEGRVGIRRPDYDLAVQYGLIQNTGKLTDAGKSFAEKWRALDDVCYSASRARQFWKDDESIVAFMNEITARTAGTLDAIALTIRPGRIP